MNSPQLLTPIQRSFARFGVLCGVCTFAFGVAHFPQRIWLNLLLNNFYFVALSVIAVCFIAIHYLANAAWLTVLRRVPEAMASYLIFGFVLMLLLYFGVHSIYHWSHADVVATDAILKQKIAFLNPTGYLLRLFFFFSLWIFFVRKLVGYSQKQDENGDLIYTQKNVRLSAIFLICFAITFTLATIDWIMSLDPHWYSTLFPWYVFSSMLTGTMALLILLVVLLKQKGYLAEVNAYHLHDLGKYLFAFSFFWGYLWYSQYMLIWYSNIPEETHYFHLRTHGGWRIIFLLNVFINLVLPFCFLLPAAAKKNTKYLFWICLFVFFGHWLDLYLLIMPSGMPNGPEFGWIEFSMFLGFVSLFLLRFNFSLQKSNLVPEKDPYYQESLHFHGA